jgi:hypothetical protein
MMPPKKKTSYTTDNAKVKITEGKNKTTTKVKKTLGSGAVVKSKEVRKYGEKGYVEKSKGKITKTGRLLGNPKGRSVRGYDESTGGGPIKYTKTGVGSALAAKKMMKKYK